MHFWNLQKVKSKTIDHQECTATLIASNWALTAAHCDEEDPVTKHYQPLRRIVLGVHDISKLRLKNEDIPGTHRFVLCIVGENNTTTTVTKLVSSLQSFSMVTKHIKSPDIQHTK